MFCREVKICTEKFRKTHRKIPAMGVNNVRQQRNNGVFFNIKFYNVGQSQNKDLELKKTQINIFKL